MLVSLTVGKVDAGVAVLLTHDKRIIEFPSILLPSEITSGSIVDVTVARNFSAESAAAKSFQHHQSSILSIFGSSTPASPVLRCRNATQTSVVLEWDPICLATASLRSLSLFRNGSKAGTIPRPTEMTSTKISGLAVDTEYTFALVLKTSAGIYSSEQLRVRTHKMTNLTGITVTPGIMPAQLKTSLAATVQKIGAKMIEGLRIDTTHFVCTEGRGPMWERAVEMNVPVVLPDWIKGCEREGRIVGVRGYYLNADPRTRQVGPGMGLVSGESEDGGAHGPPTVPQHKTQESVGNHSTAARVIEAPVAERTPRSLDRTISELDALDLSEQGTDLRDPAAHATLPITRNLQEATAPKIINHRHSVDTATERNDQDTAVGRDDAELTDKNEADKVEGEGEVVSAAMEDQAERRRRGEHRQGAREEEIPKALSTDRGLEIEGELPRNGIASGTREAAVNEHFAGREDGCLKQQSDAGFEDVTL